MIHSFWLKLSWIESNLIWWIFFSQISICRNKLFKSLPPSTKIPYDICQSKTFLCPGIIAFFYLTTYQSYACFLFMLSFRALSRQIRITMFFCFFALIMGALIWYRGKASPDVHCCLGSLSPSPLALQKMICFFEVLCVRYVALRSGSVPYTAMLLRLSRPYSYDPRPPAKKA